MPLAKRIPWAIWRPYPQWPTGPFTDTVNIKNVWHTVQGSGAGALNWYNTSGGIPTGTIVENGELYQHYELDQFSRALLNRPGGVETNRDGVLQWELAGYAGREHTPAQRATITRLTAALTEWGVEASFPLGRPRGSSDRKATFNEWDHGRGHYGHSQVPENDHTDPEFTDLTWQAVLAGFEAGGGDTMHMGIDFVKAGDGVKDSDTEVRQAVRYWQRVLSRIGLYEGPINGRYDLDMIVAVGEVRDDLDGTEINNKAAYWIHRRWVQAEAAELIDKRLQDLGGAAPHTHEVVVPGVTIPQRVLHTE